MTLFEEILTASSEELLKLLYKIPAGQGPVGDPVRPRDVAKTLGFTYAQLVCALGFNKNIETLPDITSSVGFASYDALANERNKYFSSDIYRKLGIKDVLAIYMHVPKYDHMLHIMQYVLATRLHNIETQIEITVNSMVIERYKKEIRAIYGDGVAQIAFAEERLKNGQSGFRALLNEVGLIVESKLIPIGDIFFRDSILPEEKRQLIIQGLIPKELIESRLHDGSIPPKERKMLQEQLILLDS